jgi:hypothetical protein
MIFLVFSQSFEFSVGLAENTKELPTLQGKKYIVVNITNHKIKEIEVALRHCKFCTLK